MVKEDLSGGITRVKQLLRSVSKSFPVFKTSKKDVKRTDMPSDVQGMLLKYQRNKETLQVLADNRVEFNKAADSITKVDEAVVDSVRKLGDNGREQFVQSAEDIVVLYNAITSIRSRSNDSLLDFLLDVGRMDRKTVSHLSSEILKLENARDALDKTIAKQEQSKERGGSAGESAEKFERRQQKIKARKAAYEEQIKALRSQLPTAELKLESNFLSSFLAVLKEHREIFADVLLLLQNLDGAIENLERVCEESASALNATMSEQDKRMDSEVLQRCRPKIIEILSMPDFAVSSALLDVHFTTSSEPDLVAVACPLLRILDDLDLCVPFIKFMISNELPKGSSETTLFQVPSVAGSLCDAACQMVAEEYLHMTLHPLIEQICSGEADFEVDMQHITADESYEVNLDNLTKAIQWFFDTVIISISDVPPLLRTISTHIYNILGARRRSEAQRAVGYFFLGNYICPAIRDPLRFSLTTRHVDERSARALAVIGSAMQFAFFGEGELSFPPTVKELSLQYHDRLVEVVDNLGTVSPSASESSLAEVEMAVEEEEDILSLRSFIVSNHRAIATALAQKGFSQHLSDLALCVDGVALTEVEHEKRLKPGSNQPEEEEEEEEPSSSLWEAPTEQAETPQVVKAVRTDYFVDDADCMPESAPVRIDAAPESSSVIFELKRVDENPRTPLQPTPSNGAEPAEPQPLIRPRRRYTKTKVIPSSPAPEQAEDQEQQQQQQQQLEPEGPPVDFKVPTVKISRSDIRMGMSQRMKEKVAGDEGPAEEETGVSAPPKKSAASYGRLFGIGAVFKRSNDGHFYVKKVIAGGPAHKAGITVGSRVLSIDGEKLYHKPAAFLYNLILGSEGSSLTLQVQSVGADVDAATQRVTVRRAFIDESYAAERDSAEAEQAAASPTHVEVPRGLDRSFDDTREEVKVFQSPGRKVDQGPRSSGTNQVGIGATFKMDTDGYFVIKKLAEHGAAQVCNKISVGDKVLEIDGHSMFRATALDLSRAILGQEGTWLTIILRSSDGSSKSVALKRSRGEEDREGDLRPSMTTASPTAGKLEKLRMEETGDSVGVGASFARNQSGELVVLEKFLQDVPMAAGDRVLEVDGVKVSGKSSAALEALISGPEGSTIELVVLPAVDDRESGRLPSVKSIRLTRKKVPKSLMRDHEEGSLEGQTCELFSAGVGIWFQREEGSGALRIRRVLPHVQTSCEDQINIGDLILSVDGVNLRNRSSREVVEMLNGSRGTSCKLKLQKAEPNGKVIEAKVVRSQEGFLKLEEVMGRTAGIGILFKHDRDGYFFIKRILENSPAQRTGGLEVGDTVREIDGVSLFRKSYKDLEQLLNGVEDSSIRLGIWDHDSRRLRHVDLPRNWTEDRLGSESEETEEFGSADQGDV
ncbi:hypothetical protein GUITHDRAFT_101422 [Guillardia theta CCMP2712]|uniref:Ras GTPase-activating protein n=2 Tax=Guillardia theta TaxID=55529 RepID=L1JWL8_GUITC|nr:hypothetical protein GUITHDRAFT_101422 [Guillardia theta CCMP2712]EKX52971.1 hypothetical protein GUITHDRAFT_101422 [Guillardia theta CCMP2712]|mmetsp:Transcript_41497/g.130743  ORF Transcript_41497/g.130743 Transcript_41497/m.130743 type:complete len:1387 (+) Transcript_41497:56-4216(+)|eukprot:XP_005839951.1 hypothetical protein GUITHDRAFT_101422 [Guillardia theta CCMP2712]